MLTIPTSKPFLTSMELAVVLGVKFSTIRAAMAALVIDPVKVGRVAAFPAADVDSIREKLAAAGLIDADPELAAK